MLFSFRVVVCVYSIKAHKGSNRRRMNFLDMEWYEILREQSSTRDDMLLDLRNNHGMSISGLDCYFS